MTGWRLLFDTCSTRMRTRSSRESRRPSQYSGRSFYQTSGQPTFRSEADTHHELLQLDRNRLRESLEARRLVSTSSKGDLLVVDGAILELRHGKGRR